MALTTIPPFPPMGDPNFNALAYAWAVFMAGTHTTELDALVLAVDTDATTAAAQAAAALASAAAALASQNTSAINAAAAAASAGATTWNPATNYAQGVRAIDPTSQRAYYRKVAGISATTPSADSVNWGVVQLSKPLQIVTGRTVAAQPEVEYLLTNAASTATNQLLWTQDFTNAAWSKTNLTVTPAAAYAPDGTLTATLFTVTANGAIVMGQAIVATSAVAVAKCRVKQGTRDRINLQLYNNTTTTYYDSCIFVFATPPNLLGVGWSVVDLGGGWYELSYTRTTGITIGNTLTLFAGGCGETTTAGESYYLWGAQLGPDDVGYIPTTSTAVTVTRGSQAVLPKTAVEGDSVKLSWSNGLYTNQLLRPWMPNLVTNGEFLAGSTAGWVAAATLSVVSGRLRVSATTGQQLLIASASPVPTVVGKRYRVMVQFSNNTNPGTDMYLGLGGYSVNSAAVSGAAGTLSVEFIATASSTTIDQIGNGAAAAGAQSVDFDNISVREVITINDIEDDITLDTVAKGTLELRYMDGSWRT